MIGLEAGTDGVADQVRQAGCHRAQQELAERAAEERAVGEPGDHAAADEGGQRGQAQSQRERVEAGQVGEEGDQGAAAKVTREAAAAV